MGGAPTAVTLALEAEWPYIDYAPLRALVEEGLKSDYATYVETGLAGDDPEFVALYRRGRLGVGSDDFTQRVRQAHQEAVWKATRPEMRVCGAAAPGARSRKRWEPWRPGEHAPRLDAVKDQTKPRVTKQETARVGHELHEFTRIEAGQRRYS